MATVPENEPSYEDEDYVYINHRDPRFENIYNMWRCAMCSVHPPIMSDRMELETMFFAGSNFKRNKHGFNINHRMIYPEQVGEIRRRLTSNAPSNLSEESLAL